MRTERLGRPAGIALAALLALVLWARVPQLTPAAAVVFAVAGAAALSWALDIALSVVTYYRHGTQPKSLGEVLRRHTRLRTPATATVARNVLVVAAAVAVVSASLGTGIAGLDAATPSVGAEVSLAGTVANVTDGGADDRLNETEITQAAHKRVNEVRTERGLPPFEYHDGAAATANAHAGWMANHSTLEHQSQRYACGPGANIAYTYAHSDIKTGWGETVNHYGNETAIGHYLVKQWMHSPPHREHILSQRYYAEGIGVETGIVDGKERVYAAQAFCGG